MNTNYELLPHTADIKVRITGKTLQELFAHALYAMFACIKPHYTNDQVVEQKLEVFSHNQESLLIDFLSDCLYLCDVHKQAYSDVIFDTFTEKHLVCRLKGKPIQGFEITEIKAVTRHNFSLQKTANGYEATIVFDI